MPLARVKRIHKGIPILPPQFNRYEGAMRELFNHSKAYTPAVASGIRDGHLFLDITGTGRLYGPPPDVAFRLKKTIKKEMGLDPIWSLATSKLVAKVASRVVKPVGEYIVGPGEEDAFLAPLPVTLLPGLSPAEIQAAMKFNLVKISQIRSLTPAQMEIPFPGRSKAVMHLLKGIDPEPVTAFRPDRPWGSHEFSGDTNRSATLKAGVAMAVSDLTARLRQQNSHLCTLTLAISYVDGICHKKWLPARGCREPEVFKQAWQLFQRAWHRRVRIRHISLSCTTALNAPVQGDLFQSDPSSRQIGERRLADAMDQIRARFGKTAVGPAAVLAAL